MDSAPRAPLTLGEAPPLVPPEGFERRLEDVGVALEPEALRTLGAYLGHLLHMNEKMNLTAVRDAEGAWERHALDALTLLPVLAAVGAGGRLVDIGSGGGIPGVPLAIARPDVRCVLVESIQKKAAFLRDVSALLALTNVEVAPVRAEELLTDGSPPFDVATARAVARLSLLVPLVAPLVVPGGSMVFIKGARADDELLEARAVMARLSVEHKSTTVTPTGRIVHLIRKRGPSASRATKGRG